MCEEQSKKCDMSTKILPTIDRRPIQVARQITYSHNCTLSKPMNAKHQPDLSGTYVRPSPCYSCSGDISNIVDDFIVATRFAIRAKELRAAPNLRPRPAQLHASTVNNTRRFQAVTVMTMHHILVRVHPPPATHLNQISLTAYRQNTDTGPTLRAYRRH